MAIEIKRGEVGTWTIIRNVAVAVDALLEGVSYEVERRSRSDRDPQSANKVWPLKFSFARFSYLYVLLSLAGCFAALHQASTGRQASKHVYRTMSNDVVTVRSLAFAQWVRSFIGADFTVSSKRGLMPNMLLSSEGARSEVFSKTPCSCGQFCRSGTIER